MKHEPFSIMDRLRSFRFAVTGFWTMLRYEHNAWLHAVATIMVISVGVSVQLGRHDWCLIVLAIMGVWMAEALNTALEMLADVAMPAFHPIVEKAKDVAAGAVLINAIAAVVIAVLVFTPYFSR